MGEDERSEGEREAEEEKEDEEASQYGGADQDIDAIEQTKRVTQESDENNDDESE